MEILILILVVAVFAPVMLFMLLAPFAALLVGGVCLKHLIDKAFTKLHA